MLTCGVGSAGIFIVVWWRYVYVQMCAIIRGEHGHAAALHCGIGMHQAVALLLVPDIPLTDKKKTVKKVYNLLYT